MHSVLACLLLLLHHLEVSLQAVSKELLKLRYGVGAFVVQQVSKYFFKYLINGSLYFSILQDFGDSIPGHGGITDRMDCQVELVCVCVCCQHRI